MVYRTEHTFAELVELEPGILRLTLPLPSGPRHVHCYFLRGDDGWTLVDTGLGLMDTPWEEILAQLDGPVARIFITHMHPDHIGLAGWLVRKFGVELWITRTEFLMCRTLVSDTGSEAPEEGLRFYRAAGFPEDLLENYKARFGGFGHHDFVDVGARC